MSDYIMDRPLLAVALIFAAVFAVISALVIGITAYQCGKYQDVTGLQTKAAGGSCFIRSPDGQWMEWEEWKVRDVGNRVRR